MGDRVSISFKNGSDESVVLFNHWGGKSFARKASDYVMNELPKRMGEKSFSDPGSRREPDTIMVDFISYHCHGEIVRSSLYLGKTTSDGDNSDNGHYTIDAVTGDMDGTDDGWDDEDDE